jgi:hypothetical protein
MKAEGRNRLFAPFEFFDSSFCLHPSALNFEVLG